MIGTNMDLDSKTVRLRILSALWLHWWWFGKIFGILDLL
jgi:hypothetical protein